MLVVARGRSPTARLRESILSQVRSAEERLAALGFVGGLELSDDFELVGGRSLRKRWRLGPVTVTERGEDSGLLVKKRRKPAYTLSDDYGPEDEGPCLDWTNHEVYRAPDERWMVLTYVRFLESCDPAPSLRVFSFDPAPPSAGSHRSAPRRRASAAPGR